MRFNMFGPKDGPGYAALVCSTCNKTVTFELEPQADPAKYGEGSRVLHMLGSPKPPKEVRKKRDGDPAPNDQTL
jgi:hypothetical protein